MTDPARAAADRLAELSGAPSHDVAVVLGSGWLPAADALGSEGSEQAEWPGRNERSAERARSRERPMLQGRRSTRAR